MSKRKIVLLASALCMVAILAIGGTLAYFVDTDRAANVFTVGNVDIKLIENYAQNSVLRPATGSAQNGDLKNGVTKEVSVQNVGSENGYVRVHIAIPNILDDGADTFDAGKNVLHFNFSDASVAEGQWNWSKTTGAPTTGNWNYYETTINNIKYNVYVVTYETILEPNATTATKAMHQVYLDSKVTNSDIEKINKELGANWKILVVAEGAQSEGFDNAYDALNTAFGVPGNYDVTWPE